MQRTITSMLALTLIGLAPASAAPGDVIASGSILIGGPHTELVGSVAELGGPDGIDGFAFDASDVRGVTITTVTSGTAYDLDLWFRDSAGEYVPKGDPGRCATSAVDETCVVPADAVTGYVAAFAGRQLTVEVVEV